MKLITAVCTAALVAISAEVSAQEWVSVGPEHTSVRVLVVRAGGDVLLGSPAGLLRSTDGGTTWTRFGSDLPAGLVTAVVSPSSHPPTLYVAVEDRGIYKTTNNGVSWSQVGPGLMASSSGLGTVRRLVIDPGNTQTLYAMGTDSLFKSTDGGVSWSGLTAASVQFDLAIDPQATQNLYTVVFGGLSSNVLTKSTDGGQTRSAVAAFSMSAQLVVIDPVNPAIVYVIDPGCGFAGCVSIQKSVTGGTAFSPITTSSTFPSEPVVSLAIDPQNHEILYAGTSCDDTACKVYKSLNGGTTWSGAVTHVTRGALEVLAIDPQSSTVYAGGACATSGSNGIGPCGGMAKSTNAGGSWSEVPSTGVFNAHITSTVPHPTIPTIVYAGARSIGVFKSANRGATWTPINTGLTDLETTALAVEEVSPHRVYVATHAGVFRNGGDGGGGFTVLNTGLETAGPIRALAPHKTDAGVMYACGDVGRGLYRLTGTTWSLIRTESCSLVAMDPGNPQTVYIASAPDYRVLRSTDGGTTFPADLGSPIPGAVGPLTFVTSLAIDPTNTTVLWATGHRSEGSSSGYGVFRSADAGATWTRLGGPGVHVAGVAPRVVMDPIDSSRVYFVELDAGLYILTEAGQRWTPLRHVTHGGLAQWRSPSTLVALAGGPLRLLLGTTNYSMLLMDPAAPPAGVPTCAYQPSYRGGFSFLAAGGSASVTVTAPDGCSWGRAPSFFDSSMFESTFNPWTRSGTSTLSFTVLPNRTASQGNWLFIAGHYLALTRAAPGCSFWLTQPQQTFPSSGGSGGVSVLTSAGCHWTGGTTSSWVTPWVAGALPVIQTGSNSFYYTVDPNPSTSSRVATVDVAGQTLTVTQAGAPAGQLTLDKTRVFFGAVTSESGIVTQTAPQSVRITQTGSTPIAWAVTPTQPWLKVSPSTGVGSATLTISVDPAGPALTTSGTVIGHIAMSFLAQNTPVPIEVYLTILPDGVTPGPFGTVDTPTDHRTGVTGAIPMTGWVLDEVEVARVMICRAAVGAEVAPIDPNCGGAAQIFVGFGVFIDGARPDVAAAYPTHPFSTRAGWGFMLLTNVLPNQGNGTYQFTIWAQDRDGHSIVLGTRTMTCANASATLPFGNIDTPTQGGVATGSSYVNFGWVLTPLPKTIPTDGSTIQVLVDGVSVGTADYNHARPDIQAVFPGYNNTNGAVGFRILDTTALTNGLHTISWTVTDDQGATEGIGSRFFTVSNGVAAATSAATAAQPDLEALVLETTPLNARTGWDLTAAYHSYEPDSSGRVVVRTEEVGRVEVELGPGQYTGYLRSGSNLESLPVGSQIDAVTGVFTWAPVAGFIGRYEFIFVRTNDGRAVSRRDVGVVLQPKGRGPV
jgi:photosystem II stability/assembly factor-like uncharacterized protein